MGDLLFRELLAPTVRIETVLQERLWPAMIDGSHIQLVVLNLAINAVQMRCRGGRLTITTSNADSSEPSRPPELYLANHYVIKYR